MLRMKNIIMYTSHNYESIKINTNKLIPNKMIRSSTIYSKMWRLKYQKFTIKVTNPNSVNVKSVSYTNYTIVWKS